MKKRYEWIAKCQSIYIFLSEPLFVFKYVKKHEYVFFQNTDKSKDWYKNMFKKIHRIPGKGIMTNIELTVLMCGFDLMLTHVSVVSVKPLSL